MKEDVEALKLQSEWVREDFVKETPVYEPQVRRYATYGLTQEEFVFLLEKQENKCPICNKPLNVRNAIVDHEHTRSWKKLSKIEKKKRVRGLLCRYCNHKILHAGMTVERAKNAVKYLEEYKSKK